MMRATTVIAASLLASTALADPTLECGQAASQVEIGTCVGDMLNRVDDALDVALKIATAAATELDDVTERDVYAPALAASQAAWDAYRDAQCEAVGASFGGGSGTGIAIDACRVELGRARIAELMAMAG